MKKKIDLNEIIGSLEIASSASGGYALIIAKYNLRGFLPTDGKLKIGDELLAQYVCWQNKRVLVSSRFAGTQRETSLANSTSLEEKRPFNDALTGINLQTANALHTGKLKTIWLFHAVGELPISFCHPWILQPPK
jgi:hypothetical protein